MVKRLAGTDVVKADPTFVGIYDGQSIYCWNGTQRNFCTTASDGIALQSGNVYWGVLASRRFYYIAQTILQNFSATDDEVLAAVQDPGQLGSEQAGFTADDQGRVFMLASEVSCSFFPGGCKAEVLRANDAPTISTTRSNTCKHSRLEPRTRSTALLPGVPVRWNLRTTSSRRSYGQGSSSMQTVRLSSMAICTSATTSCR